MASRAEQLKKLKELRKSGRKALDVYQPSEQKAIFEEVTEEHFNEVSKRKAREDDFVVDDHGEGYVHHALEDW